MTSFSQNDDNADDANNVNCVRPERNCIKASKALETQLKDNAIITSTSMNSHLKRVPKQLDTPNPKRLRLLEHEAVFEIPTPQSAYRQSGRLSTQSGDDFSSANHSLSEEERASTQKGESKGKSASNGLRRSARLSSQHTSDYYIKTAVGNADLLELRAQFLLKIT
ncbi:hypothetical protein TARUN_5619 [Trichoderma arundinaceum]|uniref:Uncharacterized protein n=1 Tax=Trichoderma arundinaceum TaxID=490622 RepID=A0A395NKN2_TRIAR|nr:hypothetical protein TARUN_5619 [Trichoderma arundinaceum]